MKTYILTLAAIMLCLMATAQNAVTKSEKTSCSVHETETEYVVKASFPTNKSDTLYAVLNNALGKASQSSSKAWQWNGDNYTINFTKSSFKTFLNKETASIKQLNKLKKLTASLQAALEQPQPPAPPSTY